MCEVQIDNRKSAIPITPWCNGNTAPFGGVIHGSNPCGVAIIAYLVEDDESHNSGHNKTSILLYAVYVAECTLALRATAPSTGLLAFIRSDVAFNFCAMRRS